MASLYKSIERIAPSKAPVLITGATGSGKEDIASRIHKLGENPNAPFIDVNCGSIPENLMESELFGHEKGAFTGAAGRHKGHFELVGNGTLFLDEIGELPLLQQVRLLRVLDTRTFRPVGSEGTQTFTGRIVAATNRDLEVFVEKHTFREDLFHRLNVFSLAVPPLNERLEDIPILLQHFVNNLRKSLVFSEGAIAEILIADWPGNVRQLKNFVERIAFLSEENHISSAAVRFFLSKHSTMHHDTIHSITEQIIGLNFENTMLTVEYHIIQRALEKSQGNKTLAAKALGVHRKVLERRIKTFDTDANEIYIFCAAGKKYMALFEYTYALEQYEKALEYVKRYACSLQFEVLKFEILLKQCVCLRNLCGWNSKDVNKKYDEALVLGKRLRSIEKLPPIYLGIWAKHIQHLELSKALELAEIYYQEGKILKNPTLLFQSSIAIATTKFWMGAFEDIHEHISDFITHYSNASELLIDYGYDSFVSYLTISSLASFHLGDFENARQTLSQIQRYANEIQHPFSKAMAFHAGAWIAFFLGEIEESYKYSSYLLEQTKESPCAFYTGLGMIFTGYYIALEGNASEGITRIKEGFSYLNNEGGLLFHTLYASILGRVHCIDTNIAEGFDCIEKGIRIANENKEFCNMSELLRVRGILYRLAGDEEKAETDFIRAMRIAAHLKSIPAELDACIALAELLIDTEREDEGENILGMMLAKIPKQNSHYVSVDIARAKHEKLRDQRKQGLKQ